MKTIRFSSHAEGEMIMRSISPAEVEQTVRQPDFREPGRQPREVLSRVFVDPTDGERRLLRVFIEETAHEITVVTAHKTSKLRKYLPGAKL